MTARSSDWRPSPTVCRCCFAEGCYKDISTEYFWMGKREVYSEMLSDTFDVSIAYSQSGGPNSHSRLICEPCISRLRDASDFKRQVQECERVFMQHLDPGSSSLQLESETEQPVTVKEVKIERVKKEQELTDDDDFGDMSGFPDDDDDDLDDQPLQTLASKVPKKESVELMELIENPKPVKRKSTRVKAVPVKKAKKSTPKASASKEEPKTEKKKKGESQVKTQAQLNRLRMPKRNATAILEYSTAYPFRLTGQCTLICVYCLDTFENPEEFRQHVDTDHENFKVSKAFAHISSKDDLKVDCTNLKCRICLEPSDSIEEIAQHLQNKHNCKKINLNFKIGLRPFKLQTDNWVCVICNIKMPSIIKLSRHTATHYLQHTCDICGKSYLTNETLKYHIRCSHNEKHVCRKCWREFPTAQERKEHVRTSVACMPFLCVNCGERFLSWEQKEKHHVEFHGRAKRTYNCPECAKEFAPRSAFYSHYKAYHTDDCHVCPFCGLKFDSLYKLKEHRYVHTAEKNYQCSECLKTFRRQKSLVQHMWIHSETKRFSCVICQKQFVQKISLKTHLKSAHPDVEVLV